MQRRQFFEPTFSLPVVERVLAEMEGGGSDGGGRRAGGAVHRVRRGITAEFFQGPRRQGFFGCERSEPQCCGRAGWYFDGAEDIWWWRWTDAGNGDGGRVACKTRLSIICCPHATGGTKIPWPYMPN